ncbi:VOC family protein [Vibrio sp.]|uniref:VOC family protein n=1 Tax=Vibrio viridaestus TaxID=2487322 RepID=A0A3N9TCF2_9VIBR|nr:VOC family protein [Vibrio viridaestus]MDC0610251.1 VOC family protein [Vibrio sp.]RQW61888.1 VOC family protein [Vibrio viridaestus]
MNEHEKLNYVELPSSDLMATKAFFTAVFDWKFVDYGEDYTCFTKQGLDGGFYRSDLTCNTEKGSALLVFYSEDIDCTLKKVLVHGGTIVKQIFEFPGGVRFHFTEPSGNEFAVWSERRSPHGNGCGL